MIVLFRTCGLAAAMSYVAVGPVAADTATDKPACLELEELYKELAESAGEPEPTEAQLEEAIYSDNPSNADCAAMLLFFPKPGDQ